MCDGGLKDHVGCFDKIVYWLGCFFLGLESSGFGDILFALFIQVIWKHNGQYRLSRENLFMFLAFMGKNGIDIVDVEKRNSILMVKRKN